MAVLRITTDLHCDDPGGVAALYRRPSNHDAVKSKDVIVTMQPEDGSRRTPQLNRPREGGSGTAPPALPIEVDDPERVITRTRLKGTPLEFGPDRHPRPLRRLAPRDPVGHLVNVLGHSEGLP